MCDPLSPLKITLINENRYVVEVSRDGNCLYRVLALDMFKDQERHEDGGRRLNINEEYGAGTSGGSSYPVLKKLLYKGQKVRIKYSPPPR